MIVCRWIFHFYFFVQPEDIKYFIRHFFFQIFQIINFENYFSINFSLVSLVNIFFNTTEGVEWVTKLFKDRTKK